MPTPTATESSSGSSSGPYHQRNSFIGGEFQPHHIDDPKQQHIPKDLRISTRHSASSVRDKRANQCNERAHHARKLAISRKNIRGKKLEEMVIEDDVVSLVCNWIHKRFDLGRFTSKQAAEAQSKQELIDGLEYEQNKMEQKRTRMTCLTLSKAVIRDNEKDLYLWDWALFDVCFSAIILLDILLVGIESAYTMSKKKLETDF